MITVVLVDHAGVAQPGELERVAKALTIQAQQFAAAPPLGWGIEATVRAGVWIPSAPSAELPGEWVIALLKDADQSNSLGYHDMTPTGAPCAKVFPLLDPSTPWSAIASHELLEMLADAMCNLCATTPTGRLFALEVCDPVEQDRYVIAVDGVDVMVSNWITPAWFGAAAAGAKYDYLGKLTAPLGMTRGGYSQELVPSKGWKMLTAMDIPPKGYREKLITLGHGRVIRRMDRKPYRTTPHQRAIEALEHMLGGSDGIALEAAKALLDRHDQG